MRTYISPVQLNELVPNIPDLCYKCNTYQGSLYHCDKTLVLKHICQFTSSQTTLCPQLCMFLEIIPTAVFRPLEKEKRLISVKPDAPLLQAGKVLDVPLLATG